MALLRKEKRNKKVSIPLEINGGSVEVIEGPHGEKGNTGEKGPKGLDGVKGDRGFDGSDGSDGLDGENGSDGINGLDGVNGLDGRDGAKGENGSPDTAEEIVEKINGVKDGIKLSSIKGIYDELNKRIPVNMTGSPRIKILKDKVEQSAPLGSLNVSGAGAILTNNGGDFTLNVGSPGYFYARDERASGTAGGTALAMTWVPRNISALVTNTIPGAILLYNQVTLPAGTYYVKARSPAYIVSKHKARLRNVTDDATVFVGSSCYADTASGTQNDSFMTGMFTITGEKTIEMQHFTELSRFTNGLGVPTSSGEIEIYAEIEITKQS